MTLIQLRCLREVVRQSLSISAAAAALRISQPAVSRQVQTLEAELGLPLLLRRRNRVVALTEAGAGVLAAAERLLDEAENIRLLAEDARGGARGRLVVATSHLHARYTLLGPFRRLRDAHPEVELLLLQAGPEEIPRLVARREADIGVGTREDGPEEALPPGLLALPGIPLARSLIVPRGHPLARRRRVTLAEIAAHPLVGYDAGQVGGRLIARAFAAAGLAPRIVVRASDADVVKAYVAAGLGVGIVPGVSLTEGAEGLVALDVTALLPPAHMLVTLRQGMFLRRHLAEFLRMVAPDWDRAALRRALGGG